MNDDQIEITTAVKVDATITFWIDRDTWSAMSEDEHLAYICNLADEIQRELDKSGGVETSGATLYGIIETPDPDYEIYDPEMEG